MRSSSAGPNDSRIENEKGMKTMRWERHVSVCLSGIFGPTMVKAKVPLPSMVLMESLEVCKD